MKRRLILCVLRCVVACSPATHQTKMERYAGRVEAALNAQENNPRGNRRDDMTLERHVGTWTADEEKIRSILAVTRHALGDYAQAETVFERELTRNEKALDVAGRFEAPHLALSLTGGLV